MIEKMINLVLVMEDLAITNDLHITVDSFGKKKVLFFTAQKFFDYFKDFDVITRTSNSVQFPYRASTEIEGIEFYAHLTAEEYMEFILKTA